MPRIDGRTLNAWRRSRGWDVPKTAQELRNAARDKGFPAASLVGLTQMIYAWERDDHKLSERYELLYRELGFRPQHFSSPVPDLAEVLLSPTLSMTDIALPESPEGAEEGDVDRRVFNLLALGLLAGHLAQGGAVPGAVSVFDVRRLREITSSMWAREWTIGGNALLREAIRQYAAVRAMLDHSSYTASVALELQALAAELAACAGFTAFDADMQPLARGLLSESALLAGSTGDPVLTAATYAQLAMRSTSLGVSSGRRGLAREALRFLDQAADAARHEPSPRLHAMISMRRATAAALVEDSIETRRSIATARRELDRGEHPADPPWLDFVTDSEITAHEAMAAFSLGKPEAAVTLYRGVLSDTKLASRNRALYQARLATSLQASGDLAEAIGEGLKVLPVLEGPVRSARSLHQLQPVRQAAESGDEFASRFDAAARSYGDGAFP